jgi:O-succinylbenzoic acid--CoA ligase
MNVPVKPSTSAFSANALPAIDILRAADIFGDAPLIIDDEGVCSYRTAAAYAQRCQPFCRDWRLVHGDAPVALVAAPTRRVLLAVLALWAGRVPAVLLPPTAPELERQRLWQQSGAPQCLDADALSSLAANPVAAQGEAASPVPADTAVILFTSGSSHRPKGVRLSHRAFVASARAHAANLGWRLRDRWVLQLPICHVGGLSVLTRSALSGAAVLLPPAFDATTVLSFSARHGGTLLSAVPTQLQRLLACDRGNELARLRFVLLGGAAPTAELLSTCLARDVVALCTYGLTETCSQVTCEYLRDAASEHRGSGRPLPGIAVDILRGDGTPAAPGEVGRIAVRGAVLTDGYLGAPRHAPDAAWMTGDLGRFDARGVLHVAGRSDAVIISGGENIHPAEVEWVCAQAPGVLGCIAFGVPDAEFGQVVCAALRVADGVEGGFDERALAAFLRRQLAPHKVPRRVAVWGEPFPLLSNGKEDRRRVVQESAPMLRPLNRS